jgi:hypothetical protein
MYFGSDEIEIRLDDLATPTPVDVLSREKTQVPVSAFRGFEFEMFRGGTGTMSIDNLTVLELPEPTTTFVALGCSTVYLLVTQRTRHCLTH